MCEVMDKIKRDAVDDERRKIIINMRKNNIPDGTIASVMGIKLNDIDAIAKQ